MNLIFPINPKQLSDYRDAVRTASGHRYHEIIRSLAFKWQRILFRCWKARQPYDEQRYLQRLKATGSKIIQFLPPSPDPESVPLT